MLYETLTGVPNFFLMFFFNESISVWDSAEVKNEDLKLYLSLAVITVCAHIYSLCFGMMNYNISIMISNI